MKKVYKKPLFEETQVMSTSTLLVGSILGSEISGTSVLDPIVSEAPSRIGSLGPGY